MRVAVHGPARYLIAILPFSTLLVAWLLEREFATRPVRLLYAHSFFAALLLLDGVGVMRLRVESARELLRIKLNQMYQPGDAVVVVPDQAAEVVELYAPNVRIDLALDRALTDETAIREQLVRFHDRERVFLVWLHGKQSPAVRVADELFGEGISSSPRARLGERRIFVYYPKQGPIQRQPPHEAP